MEPGSILCFFFCGYIGEGLLRALLPSSYIQQLETVTATDFFWRYTYHTASKRFSPEEVPVFCRWVDKKRKGKREKNNRFTSSIKVATAFSPLLYNTVVKDLRILINLWLSVMDVCNGSILILAKAWTLPWYSRPGNFCAVGAALGQQHGI